MKCECCPFTLPCYTRTLGRMKQYQVYWCPMCNRLNIRYFNTPTQLHRYLDHLPVDLDAVIVQSSVGGEYQDHHTDVALVQRSLRVEASFCFRCSHLSVQRYQRSVQYASHYCVCEGGNHHTCFTVDLDARIQQMRDEGEL